jgi:aspartyl/asparaginyl beta-hydroxylase (cupin superfamily)
LAGHASDCATVSRLLAGSPSRRLDNLYWYDLPLRYAASWRGFAHVVRRARRGSPVDPTAASHGMTTLYCAAPVITNGSAPTVWNCRGLESQPWFRDATDTTRVLEAHAADIRAEYNQLRDHIERHPDDRSLVEGGRWSALFLFGPGGRRNDAVCERCPTTTALVSSLKLTTNFGFVMFSELAPGTHVKPHTGSSNLRLRHHLALVAPEPGRVTLTVAGESQTWIEGRCLAFDDSFVHEVHHLGERPRAVLSVDVWHPRLDDEEVRVLGDDVFQRFGRVHTE